MPGKQNVQCLAHFAPNKRRKVCWRFIRRKSYSTQGGGDTFEPGVFYCVYVCVCLRGLKSELLKAKLGANHLQPVQQSTYLCAINRNSFVRTLASDVMPATLHAMSLKEIPNQLLRCEIPKHFAVTILVCRNFSSFHEKRTEKWDRKLRQLSRSCHCKEKEIRHLLIQLVDLFGIRDFIEKFVRVSLFGCQKNPIIGKNS